MHRFSSQGWVSNWDHSQPSVWLTAYVIRILETASFQDWEDYIYIDPTVFGSAVMWLLNYQSEEGAFYETEYTERPLHYAMFSENRSHTQYYILELSNGTSRNFTVPGGGLY